MNQKQIGIVILVIGILILSATSIAKINENKTIEKFIEEKGTCYLDDGTCLHEHRNFISFIIGWVLSGALILLSLYLIFFDKTQQIQENLAKQQVEVSSALKEAKIKEKEKDEFNAFLAGFNDEEQKVLKAIKDQEGIQQSTLRFRTGMSKTSLSIMLKSLEDRKIITRNQKGKTNLVYLRKKY